VSSVIVNEGSPFAVFIVSGSSNQPVASLSLANGNATGGADYNSTGLEFWNGTAWVAYISGTAVTLNVNGTLLVRTSILPDTVYEGKETFLLQASNTAGTAATGTGTIVDDGTGEKFLDAPPGPGSTPIKNVTGPFDDDRPLSVSSVIVNEGSPFAVFIVSGSSNQPVASLSLANGNATGGADYNSTGLEFWNGTAWVAYISGTAVTLNVNGTLLVRTSILPDTVYEGKETFLLQASNTAGTAATGTGTLVDDGTGEKFLDAPPGPGSTPIKNVTGPFDDDRTLSPTTGPPKPTLRPTRIVIDTKPTGKPSRKPSTMPTRYLTRKPSAKPTWRLTHKPSAKPTRKPSRKPTTGWGWNVAKPTRKPSRKPTTGWGWNVGL
jgi:hypothetical protein